MSQSFKLLDVFVRWLFSRPGNEQILLAFLNAVMRDAKETELAAVKVLNPFNPGEYKGEKEFILDVAAKDSHGRLFDFEIQSYREEDYAKRAFDYWARLHASQLRKGDDYLDVHPTVGVHLCDYNNHPEIAEGHLVVDATFRGHPDILASDDFQLHFVELPKYYDRSGKGGLSDLEKWAVWFTFEPEKDDTMSDRPWLPEDLRDDPQFIDLEKQYREFCTDEELRYIAESRFRFITDVANEKSWARRHGFAEGKEQGLAEGRAEGKAEGRAEGIRERDLEIASKMKARGMAAAEIADFTGLSLAVVEEL